MIPVLPAIIIGFVIFRALRRRSDAGSSSGSGESAGSGTRGAPLPGWVFWYGIWAVAALAVVLVPLSPARRIYWAVMVLCALFPWTTARLAARVGWIGAARLFGALSFAATCLDREGATPLAVALALHGRRRLPSRVTEQLHARTEHLRAPLRGAGVAARGLLAAARGHLEEARDLLRSVEHLDPRITPAVARAAAQSWLAADAAERGDWEEVARLGRGRCPRDVRFLAGCARRLLGLSDAPADARLRLWWALAPHRRASHALLRRALETVPRRAGGLPRTLPPGGTPLVDATRLHLAALARHPLSGPELGRLGRAWSQALADTGTEQALLRRELALGADGRSDVLARLTRRVRAELAWLVRESGVPLAGLGGGPALEAATAEVRGELLDDLEAQAQAIAQRVEEERVSTPVEEWRAVARLREAYRQAVSRLGLSDHRAAYAAVQPALSALSVHLFNELKEHSIGHATFSFLAAEAKAVGYTDLAELHTRNARCGW